MKIETIEFGKNNLVKKIHYKRKIFIYKKYLNSKGNGINYSRYKSETSFINLLVSKKIKNLPLILATDPKNQENLFNYIKGKKINKITKKDIVQCINFIKKINSNISNKNFFYYKKATEACISINDHICTAKRRIFLLSKFSKDYGIYRKAKLFVKNELKNKLKIVKNNIFILFTTKQINKKLTPQELILSPSDFGFHNIIKKNKKLYFFDFEYAGMDDPVKLISDYICQPDYKLSKEQSNFFYRNILKIFNNKKEIDKRFKAVINIHRIKWCCVILSEILSTKYLKRRQLAESNINFNKCFYKAKNYYKEYLKEIV
jgi:thiamine kinase-like enzyme